MPHRDTSLGIRVSKKGKTFRSHFTNFAFFRENKLSKNEAKFYEKKIFSEIFEVLLCHINSFSFFTLINVWWREFDLVSYLFKFLPVRPQYICSIFAFFFATKQNKKNAKFSQKDVSFLLETLVGIQQAII